MSNINGFSTHYYVKDNTDRDHPFGRTVLAAPAALLVTAGLIWGMERLAYIEPLDVVEPPPYVVPSPVLGEQKEIETRIEPPVKPEEPTLEPKVPELDKLPRDQGQEIPPLFSRDLPTKGETELSFSADVPIATLLSNPEYPRRAASQGIEGYVDVVFDVQASGATDNIKILSAQPDNIFDRAAVNAVKRWKFQPAEKNGKPVSFQGMTHRIVFQMARR